MALARGTQLGPYEILAPLGEGGMGAVYRARDGRLDRTVAIKVLSLSVAADPQFRERFDREARAASALNHPNILSVFDVGRDATGDYLVTELVEGETLRERLAEGPFTAREVVRIGGQIADGLAAAHAAGLVHRDLKPENVMVTRDGRVKILDFGLAKPLLESAAGQETRAQISQAGLLVGTVGYISPEQVRGQPADPRSDLFSLGAVLHEIATGQGTFARPTTVETLNAILKEDAPDLPETLPAGLRQIVAHCLEKDPSRRFQTARDVAFALRSFASTSTTALPAPPRPARGGPLVRAAVAATAAATLIAAGVAGGRLSAPRAIDMGPISLEPLAVDPNAETFPAISPDGLSTAYLRERTTDDEEIVVRSERSATPTVLTRGHAGVSALFWSPDGQRIYFLSKTVLKSVSALGGAVRTERAGVWGADLAPDGRTFAVLDGESQDGRRRLAVGPLDALRPYEPEPASAPRCSPNSVRFSPDGSQILLWLTCGDNAIFVVPALDATGKGGPARRLFEGRIDPLVAGADWLGDSRHVVLSTAGNLWLGDTRRNTLSRVTNGTTPARWPDAGPDDRVAFTEQVVDRDVVELPIAGGTPRVVVGSSQYDGSAAPAPRGDRLAYVARRGGADEIWTRTSDEPGGRRLLQSGDFPDAPPDGIRGLTFSPDGQWLAFTAFTSRPTLRSAIWVMPATGGTPRRLTPADALAIRATWSADGREMAVNMSAGATLDLWILGIGTSAPARRLDLPEGTTATQIQWSPTGEWIAALEIRDDTGAPNTLLVDPKTGATRRLPPLDSPALAWSHDGKTLYGVAATDSASELRAIDLASGAERTVARYTPRLRLAEDIANTLRLSLDPQGRAFVTTAYTDRSNVWLLKGLNQALR